MKKEQLTKIGGIIKKIGGIITMPLQVITTLLVLVLFYNSMTISSQVEDIRFYQKVGSTLTRVVTICSPDGREEINTISLTKNGWKEYFKNFSNEEVLGLKIDNFEDLFNDMYKFEDWKSSLIPFDYSEIQEFLKEANLEPSPTGLYYLEKTDGVWQFKLFREGTDLTINYSYNSTNNILTVSFVNHSTMDFLETDFTAVNPKVILSKDKNAQYILFESNGILYAINDIGSLFRLT